MDIESIIDEAEPATAVCTICIKGGLRSQWEQLEAQLATLSGTTTNLAGESPGQRIAEQMAAIEAQMRSYNRTFTLRAITPRRRWRNLVARRPVQTSGMDEETYADLYHPWLCEIVAQTAVDPTMSAHQVERLADKISNGDWKKLANTAWELNEDSSGIPFSAAASAMTRSSGGKSKQPEISESPAHDSLAGSPESSPSTSTTTETA